MREGRPRSGLPLRPRERLAELIVGGTFLIVAVAMVVNVEADREWDRGPVVALTLLFALATRVQLDVGTGYTVPTQLIFVPMLLLLPTPAVPLLVAIGWWIGRLPDIIALRVHPERVFLSFANSWFAVGPALVLAAGDAQTPEWGKWPWYLAALLAQFFFDLVASTLREWIGAGVSPLLQARLQGWIELIDAQLAPIGLLAAFASEQARYGFLLLFPALGLFVILARERAARIADAMALSASSREAADLSTRLLDSERAVRRAREEVLAGASEEMLSPLAELTAQVHRLHSIAPAEAERHARAEAAMLAQVARLRHLVGQFIDYSSIKAGRELDVRVARTDIRPSLEHAVRAFSAMGHAVTSEIDEVLPLVLADPGRVSQIVFSLLDNAVKYSPAGTPVRLLARTAGTHVAISVHDAGPGIPEGERERIFRDLTRGSSATEQSGAGLGLYLCRVLAAQQDANVAFVPDPDGGSRFTLTLRRAAH